ncbi:MAG: hypothetical protein BGO76_04335 [Caedibacter sp. 38-128]|nr:haloacid dehalogenase-like hydrolase [Holosporales bacterium]OJX04290.1 MAG: hypothetical protein BGO76_04335 [Caedibacter sp. 38-128]
MVKERKLPLCIDLDGTLIRSDVTHESVLLFIRKYPWKIFKIFVWLCRGRAFLKARLADYVIIDPALLPYNESFLDYIKDKARKGHDLYLVTAADQKCAKSIYDYLGIFKECLASDGSKNLRASTKAQALCLRFGVDHFIYAGNSRHDLPVWEKSAEIISVNTPQKVLERAKAFHKKVHVFQDRTLKIKDLLKDLTTYTWFRHNLFFYVIIMIGGYIFNKIKVSPFDFYQCMIFSIALIFSNTAAVLLGLLLQLKEVRINPITKETLLGTGHLTIVKVVYLSIIFTIIGIALGLLLPFSFLVFLILFFIFQFITSTYHIRNKAEEGD